MDLRPKRLGMLVPSSNTILEPVTVQLLPRDGSVSVHVSRLRVVQVSDDASSLDQFELERAVSAAELLADANVDLILWNGTAASWLGFARDREFVAAIERRTGIEATTAVIAIEAALTRLGARRVGLVTPYIRALEARIIDNYASIGIEVVSAVRCDLTENTAYAEITPAQIAGMVRTAARASVDAVLILCTNLAGSAVVEPLQCQLNIPVLDSVRTAVTYSLERLNRPTRARSKN